MYAKWTMSPAGYFIGVVEVNNKHYYASGRTANILERNIKATVYNKERISQSQVHLEQKPSDEIDITYASNIFKAKFVYPKNKANAVNNEITATKNTIYKKPTPEKQHITEIDEKTNELIVYEVVEIARYKLKNIKPEKIKEQPVPKLFLQEITEKQPEPKFYLGEIENSVEK